MAHAEPVHIQVGEEMVASRAREAGMDFNRELVKRLLRLIDESGMTQAHISERAGKSPSWLANLISGWNNAGPRGPMPTTESCWLLARGLGVSLAQLYGPDLLAGPPRAPRPPRGPTTIETEAAHLPPTLVEPPPPTPAPGPTPKKRR